MITKKLFSTLMVALITLLVSTAAFSKLTEVNVTLVNASKDCETKFCVALINPMPYREMFNFKIKSFERFKRHHNLSESTTLDSIAPSHTRFSPFF